MHTALQRLYKGFESQLKAVDVGRMQCRANGDPRRWSAQQIVEHLLLTYTATNENFRQRLQKGTGTRSTVTIKARVGQFVVCTLGLFPKGRISPASVEPSTGSQAASGDEMLARVRAELGRFDEVALEAERIFGDARALQHPVLGPMSVNNWRLFHLRHGEHHLRQLATILTTKD